MSEEMKAKLMTLEVLSSIKGAKESEAINELFQIVKTALPDNTTIKQSGQFMNNTVTTDSLRNDTVIESSELERKIIVKNFPFEKNGYLVVSKVIED
jgi:Asp-tRNA(Asn)/Glu-tRNA(Gln) amidotransferase C subunit